MPNPEDPLTALPFEERELSEGIAEILSGVGALSVEQIVDRAYGDGWDLGDDPEGDVLGVLEDDDEPYLWLADDRWAHLPSLLDGRTLTRRVTAMEVEHDVLAVFSDLSLLQLLIEKPGFQLLTTGSEIGFVYPYAASEIAGRVVPEAAIDELGSFVLPPDTLTGLGIGAGDLVGLSYGKDGVAISRVDRLDASADDVRRHVLGILDGSDPVEPDDVFGAVLADVPDAFAERVAPISELLDSWGVEQQLDLVAEAGFDWEQWRAGLRSNTLARRYELSAEEAGAAQLLLGYIRSVSHALVEVEDRAAQSGMDPSALTEAQSDQLFADVVTSGLLDALPETDQIQYALSYLTDPHLATVIATESLRGAEPLGAAGLGAATDGLLNLADRRSRPALHWLQAVAFDRGGDLAAAEEQLRSTVQLDAGFYPALVDLARLAGDRGDAATALALLDRVPEGVAGFLRSVLEEVRPEPARVMPRNAPCWCGSGRKFKQCHLRQSSSAPLADRAGWLYAKGIVFALESGWSEMIRLIGEIRTAGIDSEDLARQALDDGLVIDLVLFEGGAFAEYLSSRQHVLPADELLLGQQWLLTPRSVYEVTAAEPGVAVTFRDLRTGDVVRSADRLASRDLRPGQLVCSHLLPRPDGDHVIHALDPVRLQERSALIELLDDERPDPADLVAFLSRHLAPATVTNMEGHPLVLCEVTLRSPNATVLSALLEERFGPADVSGDEARWIDHVELDGEPKIRATLTQTADTLTLSTNSEERRDLVLAELLELQPGLVVESQTQESARELRVRAERSAATSRHAGDRAVGAFGQPLEEDPEVRAAVAEHVRGYEERWLNLDVPALEGLTPRQAAADPTRREDLIRLLATFGETDDPTQMSPARLRQALGLTG